MRDLIVEQKIKELLNKGFGRVWTNSKNSGWQFFIEDNFTFISVDPNLSDEEYENRKKNMDTSDCDYTLETCPYINFKTLEELEDWMEEEAARMYMSEDFLYGWFREELVILCEKSPFPGSAKYEPNHPIWDCRVAKAVSPKEAWKDPNMIRKAVDNLLWIVNKSIRENKYPEFCDRIEKACHAGGVPLLREILLRFTVAKIAPKVTALSEATLYKIIEESGIDLSKGVYCPMAGFGGIVRGCNRWFDKHGLKADVLAFDINPNFCNYYGWTQKDVLSDVVETDRVVIACPPFGLNTERWLGTPDDMYYDFHEWCDLLKKHIKAPNYIFIGPEITAEHRKRLSGLFQKKVGIQWYPEYSILPEK